MRLSPHIIVSSNDETVTLTARAAAGEHWRLETLAGIPSTPGLRNWPDLRLIVIDDETLPEASRTAALTLIREWAPRASLVYVAGQHSAETEKWARAMGVSYYTSKPIEYDRFADVLRAFLESGAPPEAPIRTKNTSGGRKG
jgi:DNA-binding NtrC family response regulator